MTITVEKGTERCILSNRGERTQRFACGTVFEHAGSSVVVVEAPRPETAAMFRGRPVVTGFTITLAEDAGDLA